jgi:hypothetical protein
VQPLRTLYNKASGYPDVQRRLSFERFEEKKGGFIFGNKIERAKKGRAKSGCCIKASGLYKIGRKINYRGAGSPLFFLVIQKRTEAGLDMG